MNSASCACADSCDKTCDGPCQQILDQCDQQMMADASCQGAASDPCEQQFEQCASATPSAAAVIKCETACKCDPGSMDCACVDQCDQQCDATCQAAMAKCGDQVSQNAQCAGGPGGGGQGNQQY
jgi:hypothetical protein